MPKKIPNPVDVHVGQRVRQARMFLSMSQEKLGDALGLTFQQVQKYEKGANRIGASRMHQISNILQREVAWFYIGAPGANVMTGESSPALGDPLSDLGATHDGVTLAQAFNKITDKAARKAIVNIALAAGGFISAEQLGA